MNKKYGKFLVLLSCLNASTIFADTQKSIINNSEKDASFLSRLKHGHVVFELGAYQGIQGKTQHINIQSLIGDTFIVSDHNDISGLVGLGYFIDGMCWNTVKMSYGINAFYLAPVTVSGNVIQENIFTNLSYRYNVQHFPIYAIATAAIHLNSSNYALVLDAGIGPNFMNVYHFRENSLDGGITIPEKPFSTNTTTTFSATFGVGLKIDNAFGEFSAGCGYRFFFLGRGEFNVNNSQVLNRLNTGNVYANAIQCFVSS